MITFAVVVAVALMLFWDWRDGFDLGDPFGGLVIGVLTFATQATLRWLRNPSGVSAYLHRVDPLPSRGSRWYGVSTADLVPDFLHDA